jgi:Ferric reductase like transmembrane component
VASFKAALIWVTLIVAAATPMAIAATSPLLAWRDAIYIVAGFAGMVALALILFQPLLAAGYLPGLPARSGRRVHRWVGAGLVAMIAVHVIGLWMTSPPDAIDALLFMSPTPFSPWGVVAMWSVFGTALLAALRGPLRIRPRVFRIGHTALAAVIAIGSVVHALLVDGAMGPVSKAAFCALVLAATAKVVIDLRAWALPTRRTTET